MKVRSIDLVRQICFRGPFLPLMLGWGLTGLVEGQEAVQVQAAPAGGAPGRSGKPGEQPGKPGEQPGKPGEQPGAKPGEPAKPEPPKTTSRPQKPETPPNAEELKVVPAADGTVRFNFQGQPWLGVLEWLARISGQSLDWQEVPADFLNLRTQRGYTIEEARDLINMHLLDRGFTLLLSGEVLRVVNITKLDPALVPRVAAADLDKRTPHEFVKVSFSLDWLIAEKAVEELKPMSSRNGKLTALKSTNRIEAIDAVVNLREIRDLLAQEQSSQGRERLVREFKLEHVRAGEILEQLQTLLGIEKPPTPEQQAQQAQMEMMRRQQGQQPAPPTQKKPEIHLIVNQRENSIVAQASTDQMATIAEAVRILDIPTDKSNSLLRNAGRMQVYRLATVDPETLVKMLQETGELDPTTRVQFDKKNRSIIVTGSLADQYLIRSLVTRLDGSDRRFDVIKLRRLEADYVAGTIEFMMGGQEKNKQQNNRGYYYDPWGYGMRNQQPEDESKKFRVDADIENNRLLIFANEVERTEIQNLLAKLGEIPAAGGNPSTMRVVDSIDPDDAEELIRRLQKTWPGVSPNPLQLAPGVRTSEEPSPEGPRKAPLRKPALQEKTTERNPAVAPEAIADATAEQSRRLEQLRLEQLKSAELKLAQSNDDTPESPADSETGSSEKYAPNSRPRGREPASAPGADGVRDGAARGDSNDENQPLPAAPPRPAAPPPIRIGRGPDGKLLIASDDPNALDQMEELIAQMAPPRRDFKVFKMKYKTTWAYGVAQNLKDFFSEGDKKKENRGYPFYYYYDYYGSNNQNTDSGRRLSKRRPLKFIDDTDSNSILVTGADAQQLKIIEELIALYDVPESKDPQAARLTRVYHVKYSKSRIIADAVKEVYRDLLSANDPAMQQGNKKDDRIAERSYTYVYSSGGDDKKPETPVKFKGALSIGVDELSNTLIVSAGEGLLENVIQTMTTLDEAARKTIPQLQVLKLDRNIDVGEVQQRLSKLITKPQQQQQKNGQRQPQQPQQPQNNVATDSTIVTEK